MRITTLVFLAACSADTVELTGTVFNGPASSLPATGATLALLDPNGGVLVETTTDAEGAFVIDVEPSINVFAEITGADARTTTFPGVVGAFDSALPDGTLYTFAETEAAEVESLFADCPGGQGSGLVLGEVRHIDVVDQDGAAAINIASRVSLILEDGGTQSACYYDDGGVAYAPDALLNGPSGRFVLLNVPAGLHTLEIVYNVSVDVSERQEYPVLVSENASLSPWYPAYVALAGF
jgi:hypothetical protein